MAQTVSEIMRGSGNLQYFLKPGAKGFRCECRS
jgi:hypothetical protein